MKCPQCPAKLSREDDEHICDPHYYEVMQENAVLTAERDALRREVEAGKEKQADFVRITLDAVTEFFSHPGIKELRESLDASATEKLLALEEAFAALEGESR